MNVIFIDIDGVLKPYHFFVKNIDKEFCMDESRVALLKKICDITNSYVVLSSSWKEGFEEDFTPISKSAFYLLEIFKKYEIPIIGRTPSARKYRYHGSFYDIWKEYEILKYLSRHPEVEHFCIIDDEDDDLQMLKDYVVLTKDIQEKEEQEGLTEEYIDSIVKVLQKPRIRKNRNVLK